MQHLPEPAVRRAPERVYLLVPRPPRRERGDSMMPGQFDGPENLHDDPGPDCPESKMDDGSHGGDFTGPCPWCGQGEPPVPGGPPMREGNNPRTGIAWNE